MNVIGIGTDIIECLRIAQMIERVLEAEQEQSARVHVLQKPEESTTFVLAAMPRGRWSEELREGIEELFQWAPVQVSQGKRVPYKSARCPEFA